MTPGPGNNRSVDGAIEPIRLGLMGEQDAEHGYEDRAASQQHAGPSTDRASQHGPAEP
jgi:hypothetical protein